jgi:hypothetical protein
MAVGLVIGATSARASPSDPVECLPPSPAAASAEGLRHVSVDAAATVGTLRSFQGVNGAPAPNNHKPPGFTFGGWNMPENVDVSAGYRLAQIDLVRTHDAYGPGDIDAHFAPGRPAGDSGSFNVSAARDHLSIFPDPNADPTDPRSYNFGPTDRLISSIVRIGAQTLFRIGRSETSDVTPPRDFDHYAAIAEHIVLHYNRGWANGFNYGLRYFEVWNEPDLGRLFWGGTPQQFYELYAKIARAIKRADPQALVGGPTLAKPNDATAYRDGFLEYVRAQHVPLDFYPWHWYATDSNDPLDFVRIARNVRARLDRFGFQRTLNVLDEWNYGLTYPLPSDLERASFVASSLVYFQDTSIDLAALYRADNLFGNDGATPNKTGAALVALGRLRDTPLRLRTTGADLCGFAVQAGRSVDGETLAVLISNYQIPAQNLGPRSGRNVISVPDAFEVSLLHRRNLAYAGNRGYDLTLEHLPPGERHVIERYRISSDRVLTLVDRDVRGGSTLRLSAPLPPPAIELIVVRNTRAPP